MEWDRQLLMRIRAQGWDEPDAVSWERQGQPQQAVYSRRCGELRICRGGLPETGTGTSSMATISTEQKRVWVGIRKAKHGAGPFLPSGPSRICKGDIIVSVDDKRLKMTAGQLDVFIRLNYQPGQQLTFNLLRGGRPENVTMTLPAAAP